MKAKKCIQLPRNSVLIVAVALVFSIASATFGQGTVITSGTPSENKTALYNAFETAVAFGYNQGVGDVGTGVHSLTDMGGPGVSGELDLGWRINPSWLIGAYGTVAWLSTGSASGDANNNWTTTAGLQGNFHFLPGEGFDPWIGLGAGWRGYFVNRPVGSDIRHGIDVARLQVGLDIPVTKGVAISPFAGATAALLLTQKLAQDTSFSNISNPNVNLFLNAGVMGRFDLFGSVR
jgi:hypothetical protein